MYRVTVRTEGVEHLLHDPRDDDAQLLAADLTEEVGRHPTFAFTIAPHHPNKDKIIPMASEVMAYRDGEMICCCRMISSQSDLYNTGQAVCEGESGYLLDSIQRPYEFAGSAWDLFVQLLSIHNSQVEERKRMEPGRLDANEEITRSNKDYATTLGEIQASFCEGKGCYFHLRYGADGKKYLDCVRDYGDINKQAIRFGENLVSLKKKNSPAEFLSALIPMGEEVTGEAGEKKAVSIASVNEGRDYIIHNAAAGKYGMVWGAKKFDGVTEPETLLAKARAYLEDATELPEAIEVKAIDLSLVDQSAEPFRVGCWTDVDSPPHGLKTRMLLAKKRISLVDPRACEISLGSVRPTFTAAVSKNQAELSVRVDKVANSSLMEIDRRVENATRLITGGLGGYVLLDVMDPDTGKRTTPWRMLVMDAPEKEDAVNVIQINKNGIGFSTTGINGPYRNAWTIDGSLTADAVATGTMLADRIRGGSLELGGRGLGRDGALSIRDAGDALVGKIDKTGIQILLGGDVGFAADGKSIVMGGFKVANAYGRQILQSTDERTGMSGEPNAAGRFYLWAGYKSDSDYAFAVNNRKQAHAHQLYCHDDDDFYQGRTVTDMLKELSGTGTPERLTASKPKVYDRESDAAMLRGTVTRVEVE